MGVPGFPSGRVMLELIDLDEFGSNMLRVEVAEMMEQGPAVPTELGLGVPIVVTEDSRRWILEWEEYVAFAVRNESYFVPEPGDPEPRDTLYARKASAMLDYVAATTFATDDFPGPLTNWSLYMMNHCLDVVSVTPPKIVELKPDARPVH